MTVRHWFYEPSKSDLPSSVISYVWRRSDGFVVYRMSKNRFGVRMPNGEKAPGTYKGLEAAQDYVDNLYSL